mgnify:CR=1 FL=1
MKTFVLVISMWGNDGAGTDHYIGQMAMQTPMSQEICEKFKIESVSSAAAYSTAPNIGAARSGGMMFAAGTQTATVISNGATPTSPPPDYTARTDEYAFR